MASKIKITPAELRGQAVKLENLSHRIGDFSAEADRAIDILNEALSGKFSANMRLKATSMMAQLRVLRNTLKTGSNVANKCADTYQNTDKVLRETIGDSLSDETINTPVSTQQVVPEVRYNPNGSIPNSPSKEITPFKSNVEGERHPDVYKEVLADLDVANRYRYTPRNGNTWCNIYVWDATRAMGCEIPHYYDKKTGAPLTRDYCLKNPGTYLEMSANRMTKWLGEHGDEYGWVECDAATAIERANNGFPTVVAATTTGHVGMVVPQENGDTGVMISQAGGSNFNYGKLKNGFGNHSVKYYYHL